MAEIAFHFAGGDAFFTGAGLILAACAIAIARRKHPARGGEAALALVGGVIVALSATPLPGGLYTPWGLLLLAWLMLRRRTTPEGAANYVAGLTLLLFAATAFCLLWEGNYRRPPTLRGMQHERMAVIGDSISAGMLGGDEPTWPRQFRETTGADLVDVSQEGATARGALRQAARIPEDVTLVVIEIGGNDVLGETSRAQFADDLAELLAALDRPNRELVMLELPLPPLYNSFGRAQRALAARHGAALISKRDFAAILFTEGATLDGLHLSERGHRLMAEMIRRRLGPALRTQPRDH